MLGVCQDVTEWHLREAELVEAQAQAEPLSRRLQSGLLPSSALLGPGAGAAPGTGRGTSGRCRGRLRRPELPDGTAALLIGDVAGNGPVEAAVGAASRAAWRALVLTGHGPDDLLDGLDLVLARDRQSEELFATVCCCWIGPTGSGSRSPWPAIPCRCWSATAKSRSSRSRPGPPSASTTGATVEAGELRVAGPWTLLCYTDGLVEGRSVPVGGAVRDRRPGRTAARPLEGNGGLEQMLDGLLDVVHEANGGDLRRPGDPLPVAGHRGQRPGEPARVGPDRPAPHRPASARPAASSPPRPPPGRSRSRRPATWS